MSPPRPPALSLERAGIARGRPGRERWLVRDVDLELPAQGRAGELLAVVGPNGAGKTSLLRLCAGIWTATAGTVRLDGTDLATLSRREAARRMAYVPQSNAPPLDFTVEELVQVGRYAHQGWLGGPSARDRERVHAALARCDVLHLARRSAARLSGGELQRVLIARCLATDARILVLDEPTANLDVAHVLAVMQLLVELARAGSAVAVALHDLELARRFADRVALLSGGRLLAMGPPAAVLTADHLRDVFGVRVDGELSDRSAALRFELAEPPHRGQARSPHP